MKRVHNEPGSITSINRKGSSINRIDLGKSSEANLSEKANLTADEMPIRRSRLRRHLINAIRNQLFDVYYQPQISLKDDTCTNFEALLRWKDPELGVISPAVFIPAAEDLGLIDEITLIVIERVTAALCRWQSHRLPVQSVAINISACHFDEPECAERLLQKLLQSSKRTSALKLELTETAVLSNPELARGYMQKLHDSGFNIALDDFGTGYSSFAYLRDLPISSIKIDQTFVKGMLGSNRSLAIVRSLVELAAVLDMQVVAEGIESREQARLLRSIGCDFGQGYYFSKAMPESAVAEYMHMRKAHNQAIIPGIYPSAHMHVANF